MAVFGALFASTSTGLRINEYSDEIALKNNRWLCLGDDDPGIARRTASAKEGKPRGEPKKAREAHGTPESWPDKTHHFDPHWPEQKARTQQYEQPAPCLSNELHKILGLFKNFVHSRARRTQIGVSSYLCSQVKWRQVHRRG